MAKPITTDHPPYFSKYINLIETDDLKQGFEEQNLQLVSILNTIIDSKADYAYAAGKWTVKQLLQHVIDTERVFAYRALFFARNAKDPLPSFDENAFAEIANTSKRNLQDLKNEFITVRKSTQILFNSFTEEDLQRRGIASSNEVTVNALGFIILGHWVHHCNILKERYL
jgi:uncharacterized damage-inducible protein DinB